MKVNYTIKEIKTLLEETSVLSDELFDLFSRDERKGVQKLLAQYERRQQKQMALEVAFQERLAIERELYQQSQQDKYYIAGIDEVGRGPLAGPIVAAVVILPENPVSLIGVNDSKQLSDKKRREFAERIQAEALAYSIAEVSSQQIDEMNIYRATQLAMETALTKLSLQPNHVLIDAMTIQTSIQQSSLIKGDQRSLSIAAASILAKVYRDDLMKAYSLTYPEFGFEANAGYGTKQHLEALRRFGYTPIHRRSFEPVASMTKQYQAAP
ncbi:ribonuclease HII [Suicoccus acidiformans]|uniref:Ribonuclease HII n=1 Tax=Suicoccus acidiformans TaxID=2036206 RepID=A0A347WKG9_9LACT|nr:ribonuclease HII [Suicoccus acidiformans]AXY25576.1 ribonuclease HII [Suicoccus acidiformans]